VAFIFRPHILDKIWQKHQVIEDEVEEVYSDPDRITERTGGARGNNRRYLEIGETKGGRILRIVYEAEYNDGSQGSLILITAFEAPEADRKRYRRKVRGR